VFISLVLSITVAALFTAAYQLRFFSSVQNQSSDVLFASRVAEHAQATVIVGIDQRTYRKLLPHYGALVVWPRTLYARTLDALRLAGARVVAFDIFFDAAKPDDHDLVAAMTRFGNVVLPVEAQGPQMLHPAPGVAQAFDVFVRPTPAVAAAAGVEGTVNITTDRDTVVRSLPLLLQSGEEVIPAFSLAAVSRFIRRPTILDDNATNREVYAAGRIIPLSRTGSMAINFLGPPSSPERGGAVPILSMVDVLDGSFDHNLVKDKIVVIGLTIRGVDEFATPTTADTRMWGAEIQASAIETILRDRYLVTAASSSTIGTIMLLAVLSALLVALVRPFLAVIGLCLVLLSYFLAAGAFFDAGTLLNLVYPPAAAIFGFAATLVYRVVFEQRQQRVLRGVMARYLSPSVSQWVLQDPDRLRLGGETRTMTVLFCDLRGFTTYSHKLAPETLVALLNEYMTAMTHMVFQHDGVLDKYIGDAIMAFWNAPLDQPDHAGRACRAALDMLEALRGLQDNWRQRTIPAMEVGIGINTGSMVVGNMGAHDRLAYTVMGDTVNVASRLEGLSKEYGTRIVVGESTREAAGDEFVYRFLDVVAVKGRSEPLAVYEIVGRAGQLDEAIIELLERFQAGVDLYRSRRWAEAEQVFQHLHSLAPQDGPSALYLRRSQALLRNPPPQDWNGIYIATAK
jgi:adenylate cyclase